MNLNMNYDRNLKHILEHIDPSFYLWGCLMFLCFPKNLLQVQVTLQKVNNLVLLNFFGFPKKIINTRFDPSANLRQNWKITFIHKASNIMNTKFRQILTLFIYWSKKMIFPVKMIGIDLPGFGAKTLIFEPSCMNAAMVIPEGVASFLGAHRIVLCIRLTLLTEVRRNIRIMWCKTSKMVTREHPIHSPENNIRNFIHVHYIYSKR